MVQTKKVRYGIIGFGGFAERVIATAILESPNSQLVALQKRSAAEAKAKAEKFNIPLVFSSAEELVRHSDVDAVFIASPNALHAEQTILAARAGKHVLVEKPMAMNSAEAQAMIDACKDNNVKLMVGHMVRFSPAIQWLKKLVKAETLGEIQYVRTEYVYNARFSKRKWLYDRKLAGGGPWFDIGVHCLDTMRYVLEDDVVSVRSHMHPTPTEERTEGTFIGALQFSKGTIGSITCSFEVSFGRSIFEIVGTEGTAALTDFTLSDRDVKIVITGGKNGAPEPPDVERIFVPNLYEREFTLFSDAILDNIESPIPGEEGLKNQLVLDEGIKV
jgi:predicted dehydrogenase